MVLDDSYREAYEKEVRYVCSMLEQRSLAFLKSAKEVGLETLPYERGFFICVPSSNPEKLMNELHQDGVYVICTHSALRIALCGINKNEAGLIPAIIKKHIEK